MPMFRTKPIQARLVDFNFPDQIADIAAWCGGKVFGRKLMVDVEGSGRLAWQGWYVVETARGEFFPVEAALFLALFEMDGRSARAAKPATESVPADA